MTKPVYTYTNFTLAFSFKTLLLLFCLLPTSLFSKALQNSPQEVCNEKSSLNTTYTLSFHNANDVEIFVSKHTILHLGKATTTLISTQTPKKTKKKTDVVAKNEQEKASDPKSKDQALTFKPLPLPHRPTAVSRSLSLAVLSPQTHKLNKQAAGKDSNKLNHNITTVLDNKATQNAYTKTSGFIAQHFYRHDYSLPPPFLKV